MVEVDESVDGAVNVMLQRRYASLPVVNRDGELVGVVHLLDVLGKRGAVSLYVKVMGSYVRPDSALYDAWEAMSREGTTWMPGEGRGTHRDIDGGIHEEDIRFMDSLDQNKRQLILNECHLVNNSSSLPPAELVLTALYTFKGVEHRKMLIASGAPLSSMNTPQLHGCRFFAEPQRVFIEKLKRALALSSPESIIRLLLRCDALQSARKEAVPEASLWLDANQAHTDFKLRLLLRRLAGVVAVICLEQPVPTCDFFGLRRIASASPMPVAVDESLFSHHDLVKLVRFEALDALVLKVAKSGIRRTLKIYALAEAAGLGCLGSGMTQSGVGLAASIHVFSTLDLAAPVDTNGPQFLRDLLVRGLEIDGAKVKVPEKPGLGVEVDERKLEEYRAGAGQRDLSSGGNNSKVPAASS